MSLPLPLRQPLLLALALLLTAAPAGAQPAAPITGSAAAREAARRFLCPHGGWPQPGGRCAPGGGMPLRGWDRGLPPANHSQGACPEGLRSATVPHQAGVFRCLP